MPAHHSEVKVGELKTCYLDLRDNIQYKVLEMKKTAILMNVLAFMLLSWHQPNQKNETNDSEFSSNPLPSWIDGPEGTAIINFSFR